MNIPKIAVVIPAKGYPPYLDRCLRSILELSYVNLEIVIVDDGLDKDSKVVLERYKDRIKILNSYSKGPSYARNLGVKSTKAEFVAFTDSDCIVDRDWLEELLKGLKEYPEVIVCGGIQELPQDATAFERRAFLFMKKTGFITDYMRQTKGANIIEVNHNPSCNVMYKRDVFLKEGGFLEGLWPGEDVEFDYRLKKKGYKLICNPKAVIYHYRPKDLKSFLKMMYRYGWAQGFLVRKYGRFRKIQLLPFLSLGILGLIISCVLLNFILFLLITLSTLILFFILYFGFNVFLLAFSSFLCWNIGFFKKIMQG